MSAVMFHPKHPEDPPFARAHIRISAQTKIIKLIPALMFLIPHYSDVDIPHPTKYLPSLRLKYICVCGWSSLKTSEPQDPHFLSQAVYMLVAQWNQWSHDPSFYWLCANKRLHWNALDLQTFSKTLFCCLLETMDAQASGETHVCKSPQGFRIATYHL